MKKMAFFFGVGFIVITACMVYLIRSGISLRSAPLIKPTVIDADQRNIAAHLILRLYPQLLNSHYLVIGASPETDESQRLISMMTEEYFKLLKKPVQILSDAENLSAEEIAACPKPCWLLVNRGSANELDLGATSNAFIQSKVKPLGVEYLNLSLMAFDGDETVTEFCNQEKRLTIECVTPVSVREVQRKLKNPSDRYFFMRMYNERDYFLFIQNVKGSL